MTHICVSKLTIIGSDNGLPPGRRQAIIWNNDEILLIQTLGTNLSEILSEIHSNFIQENAFQNVVCKMASILSRLQWVNRVLATGPCGQCLYWSPNSSHAKIYLIFLSCCIYVRKDKNIFTFSMISWHSDGTGSWNPSCWKLPVYPA